jgi:hypothetical protein
MTDMSAGLSRGCTNQKNQNLTPALITKHMQKIDIKSKCVLHEAAAETEIDQEGKALPCLFEPFSEGEMRNYPRRVFSRRLIFPLAFGCIACVLILQAVTAYLHKKREFTYLIMHVAYVFIFTEIARLSVLSRYFSNSADAEYMQKLLRERWGSPDIHAGNQEGMDQPSGEDEANPRMNPLLHLPCARWVQQPHSFTTLALRLRQHSSPAAFATIMTGY